MSFLDFAIDAIAILAIAHFGTQFVTGYSKFQRRDRKIVAAAIVEPVQEVVQETAAIEEQLAHLWGEIQAMPETELEPEVEPVIEMVDRIAPFIRPQSPAVLPDWGKMTAKQLRKECQVYGVRCFNVLGKGRHMSRDRMILELKKRAGAASIPA